MKRDGTLQTSVVPNARNASRYVASSQYFGLFLTLQIPCDIQGDYQPEIGSDSCMSCPVGSVAAGTANTECEPCPSGFFSQYAGGTECTECAEGQFNMISEQGTCHQCSENSHSVKTERDKCLCNEGYYMLSRHRLVYRSFPQHCAYD